MTPSSGTGLSQTFSFLFSDPKGYASIISASMTIGASASVAGSCYIYYSRAANTIELANDAGNAWLAPGSPGPERHPAEQPVRGERRGLVGCGSGTILDTEPGY